MPFRQVFNPRAEVCQTPPLKAPGFIPQLTPLSTLKNSARCSDFLSSYLIIAYLLFLSLFTDYPAAQVKEALHVAALRLQLTLKSKN